MDTETANAILAELDVLRNMWAHQVLPTHVMCRSFFALNNIELLVHGATLPTAVVDKAKALHPAYGETVVPPEWEQEYRR